MALVKCPECNNEVSDKASSCPKCGVPLAASNPTQSSEEITNGIQCPFCKHQLEASAITCGFCGAEYGYYNSKNGQVSSTLNFKSIFTFMVGSGISTVVLIGLSVWFQSRRSILALFSGMGVLVSLMFIFFSILALINTLAMKAKGKNWWKTR